MEGCSTLIHTLGEINTRHCWCLRGAVVMILSFNSRKVKKLECTCSVHVLIIIELTITCNVQQIHVHVLGLMFGFLLNRNWCFYSS